MNASQKMLFDRAEKLEEQRNMLASVLRNLLDHLHDRFAGLAESDAREALKKLVVEITEES